MHEDSFIVDLKYKYFYPLDHCRIFNAVTNKEVKDCKRRFFSNFKEKR